MCEGIVEHVLQAEVQRVWPFTVVDPRKALRLPIHDGVELGWCAHEEVGVAEAGLVLEHMQERDVVMIGRVACLFLGFADRSLDLGLVGVHGAAPCAPRSWLLDFHRAMGDEDASGATGFEQYASTALAPKARAV